MREVEEIRRTATTVGFLGTAGVFAANELSRLALRSPMFKLGYMNIAFVLFAPTILARLSYNEEVNSRVDNLWRIHRNREDAGMGGTYTSTRIDNGSQHYQDTNYQFNAGFHVRMEQLINGARVRPVLENPFSRFNDNIMNYSSVLEDMDDITLYQVDNYERLKPYKPNKKNVVGICNPVPQDDNDELLKFYDIQGESLYTNPPDSNNPTIDHGLEEDDVWAFRLTGFNQMAVDNSYVNNIYSASRASHVPFWGKKLIAPAFYKDEKFAKYMEQW